jgi:CO dehydrogenase/acetyl-CoA synthase epsilon subunit
MRLYKQLPDAVLRIMITQQGHKSEYMTVCDATQDECIEELKKIVEKQNLSIFAEGKKTTIQVREAIGAKNGKCKSFAFKGLTPNEVYSILIKEIK